MSNLLHRMGDAAERIAARLSFAFRVLIGRYPLPTPAQEANMAAIDDLNAAVSRVQTYVASLQGDLANADQTPAINSATAALNAIVPPPAPAAEPEPVLDANGDPVTE